ncbi:MAG: class I SAM-dependent methyltransferase [Acidimicrobiales bacterium]|nr:class I SAM-dependent methyltransferase [Acidimicrobiales bacterium]
MKLTGERPIEGQTPDSLLGLHAAGYRQVLERIGPGRFLDVGCGLGDGTAGFLGGGRAVVGIDYDPATAAAARTTYGPRGLQTACCDGARIGLRTGAFDWVCSSHLIEHFERPEGHVAEVSRVLAPGGAAFFLTPNAPADFENPYHVHLFEPDGLRAMLGRSFDDVQVIGLDGSAAVKADFEQRRRAGRRLLALDVFDLRHRLPRRYYVALHATARRVAYRLLSGSMSGGTSGITADDFTTTEVITPTTEVLLGVARSPRR